MLGIEQGIRNSWAFRLSTPRQPDFPATGSMPPDAPRALFQTGLFARNGLSLARHDLRLREFRNEVKVPDLLLRFRIWSVTPPGPPSAPQPIPVCPGFGCFHAQGPLRFQRQTLQAALPTSTPPRDFYLPVGSMFRLVSPPPNPPSRTCPISVRSPEPFLFLGLAPDHRSRSATAP
jgi:hypothetical protein